MNENEERRDIPTTEQLERELKRLRYRHSFIKSVWSTVSSLIVVAAIAVIISTMLLPVLRVTGTSMNTSAGYYSISENGLVVIRLSPYYIDYITGKGFEGNISFTGTFNRGKTEEGDQSLV